MSASPFFQELRSLVASDETEVALQKLLDYLKGLQDKNAYNTVILISGRYRRLSNEQAQGIIYPQDARIERAQINAAFLSTLQNLEKKLVDEILPSVAPELKSPIEIPEFAYEKLIGDKSNIKKISWLQLGLEKEKSICRIVNRLKKGVGTGFMAEDGYLYTNHHVIGTREEAETVEVNFNFNEDATGMLMQYYTYRLEAQSFQTCPALDVSRAKILTDENLPPLSEWKHLKWSDALPKIGEHVTIIQHPEGGTKQIAMTENKVVNIFNAYLQYTTDTLAGSSGSPVFNDLWEVVAIHHAGGQLKKNERGDMIFANQAVAVQEIRKAHWQ